MAYGEQVKFLLVRPPRRDAWDAGLSVPPLGLAYVASALREAGTRVEVLDAYALGLTWDEFEQALSKSDAEVLGLGTMTPVADSAYRTAVLARDFFDFIVLGGPHPTAVKEAVFQDCEAVDHLVFGEAEEIMAPYVSWLEGGAAGAPPAGVMARDKPFESHTPSRPIDSIQWPARDLLPNHTYRYLMATRPGFATLISSRGCPFRCSFCDKSVSGSRWRARSAKNVVEEMAELSAQGVGFINFYDDNFTLNRARVLAICDEIEAQGVDVHWKCEGRVDGVDLALLQRMRRAGCRVIAYGVESGNRETLALLRKDVQLEEVIQAFSATREAGLRSLAYLILGAPGESTKDVERSIRFVRELGADYVQFSALTALPGTPLFASHRDEIRGSVRSPVDSESQKQTLTDLPVEELDRLMRYAWRSFYLRPTPMARLAKDAVNSGSVSEAWRLGKNMARWSLGSTK
jgi:anaerobic magnesium-protoporphyrin IX monomethyl ester cyclase